MTPLPDTDGIRLSKDRLRLTLSRAAGEAELAASALRESCRCAGCERARRDGHGPVSLAGLTISRIDPIGRDAVNLHFSDGHARGIFPWAYLWQLAEQPSVSTEPA